MNIHQPLIAASECAQGRRMTLRIPKLPKLSSPWVGVAVAGLALDTLAGIIAVVLYVVGSFVTGDWLMLVAAGVIAVICVPLAIATREVFAYGREAARS